MYKKLLVLVAARVSNPVLMLRLACGLAIPVMACQQLDQLRECRQTRRTFICACFFLSASVKCTQLLSNQRRYQIIPCILVSQQVIHNLDIVYVTSFNF